MTVVRVGSRNSALALWQAHYVVTRLRELAPHADIQIVEIVSAGDQVIDVPLVDMEGTGFFTAALERALLDGRVDVAVHSYKDLPVIDTPGLSIAAVPARGPVADALCARAGETVESLPRGAAVGTCSARREAQLRLLRPDLTIRPLRGNVPTRLRQLDAGRLHAVVLAKAGLVRLGLEGAITEVLPMRSMLPAPAQGALAVQTRSDDPTLVSLLAGLDHAETRRAATAERTMLHALGGGCSTPVGAWARRDGARFTLTGGVFALDGSRAIRTTVMHEDPRTLGLTAARHLLDQGAASVLAPILAARTAIPPQGTDDTRRGPRVVGA